MMSACQTYRDRSFHTSKREGTNKAESAKKSMLELNEHIKVNTYPEYLYADNAEELFKEYDFYH